MRAGWLGELRTIHAHVQYTLCDCLLLVCLRMLGKETVRPMGGLTDICLPMSNLGLWPQARVGMKVEFRLLGRRQESPGVIWGW